MSTTDQEESVLASHVGGSKEKKAAVEVTEEARDKGQYAGFGQSLFLGHFDAKALSPFPLQSLDDKKLADPYIRTLIRFLQENLDPEEVDKTREIPKEVIQGLKEMGAFALKIPKEYGGLGFSQTNYNRIIHVIASYCGSTAVLLSAHQSIGVPQPLKMFGTEEQRKKYFPKFREGSISAFALTEPEVGSDPAKMSSRADISEDGSHYILNGEKLWCTNGTIADVIVVLAKTAPKIVKGKEKTQISAFIVEMNTPGIHIAQRCEFMGLGGIYNGYLTFSNVKIPKENLIGEEGRGLAIALATVNVGRLTLPAASCAGAKQCAYIARKWGKERVQWGLPVGEHEEGREKLAFINATIFAMEAVTSLTSAWQDAGKDIRIEAAMAKLFCTESLWQIADMTLQLRGGRGYEKASSLKARGEPAYPVERILRDCRINRILEGSSEIMRLFLAREALDPHLQKLMAIVSPKNSLTKRIKAFFQAVGFYTSWLWGQYTAFFSAPSFEKSGKLRPHFQFIEKTTHILAKKLFWAMVQKREALERHELLLGRLTEIATDLFVMSAALSYAESSEKRETAEALADYFCKLAERRIRHNEQLLRHNLDKESKTISDFALSGELSWLEEGVIPLD